MTNDISKTIVFRFTNKLTKQLSFSLRVPYRPAAAALGYYSSLYKRMKPVAADKCQPFLIACKISFEESRTKEALITLGNGITLEFPWDITKKDHKIILHHLEGIKMSLTD